MLCSHFGYMIKSTQVKDHGHVLLTLEYKLYSSLIPVDQFPQFVFDQICYMLSVFWKIYKIDWYNMVNL